MRALLLVLAMVINPGSGFAQTADDGFIFSGTGVRGPKAGQVIELGAKTSIGALRKRLAPYRVQTSNECDGNCIRITTGARELLQIFVDERTGIVNFLRSFDLGARDEAGNKVGGNLAKAIGAQTATCDQGESTFCESSKVRGLNFGAAYSGGCDVSAVAGSTTRFRIPACAKIEALAVWNDGAESQGKDDEAAKRRRDEEYQEAEEVRRKREMQTAETEKRRQEEEERRKIQDAISAEERRKADEQRRVEADRQAEQRRLEVERRNAEVDAILEPKTCNAPSSAEIEKVRENFELDLYDAQSARFKSVCRYRSKSMNEFTVLCGVVNSKNAMGAYVGYHAFYAFLDHPNLKDVIHDNTSTNETEKIFTNIRLTAHCRYCTNADRPSDACDDAVTTGKYTPLEWARQRRE